ncbi:MAG: aminopeptidase P N-terminal domain-containing protein [Acidobacteria bacterium]|nr:aminopeptidase P N-terminal domain-containing protein [Acidobacteriota bacterium]
MAERTVFARRRAFLRLDGRASLLFAAPEAAFGHDVHYRYRPDPDFFYLTGFRRAGRDRGPRRGREDVHAFRPAPGPRRETWEGRRAGRGGRQDVRGRRGASRPRARQASPDLVRKSRVLHHALGLSDASDRLVAGLPRASGAGPVTRQRAPVTAPTRRTSFTRCAS